MPPINAATADIYLKTQVRHFPLKRLFDICFSVFVLLAGAPVFALIALSIIYSSKGSILYSQERVGRGGKLFRCYKFRTMYVDADKKLYELLASNPAYRKEWEETQKLKADPRVSPLGAFLRKTSLDELPQFWNVLVGDLSIVGPRPVLIEEVYKHMGKKSRIILSVRPGITGLWQVFGRSNTNYRLRIRLDEKYVYRRNFLLDLFLIFKTIPVVLFCRGAY